MSQTHLILDVSQSYMGTNYSVFLQLGVSTVCKRLSEAVRFYVAKGVCTSLVYTPIQLLVWELPLGVLVLHSESKQGSRVGEGIREGAE